MLNDISSTIDLFQQLYSESARAIYFAPGRVNLIGEHIDYNGGKVLPAAISLGIYALISPRQDRKLVLNSLNVPGTVEFNLENEIVYDKKNLWANYPLGVAAALRQANLPLEGANILFQSNLPHGSGLSSSAAIEVLTWFMLQSEFGSSVDEREKIALQCQKVENEFIGVHCGIMDQFAIAMGKKDSAILLDTSTLEHEYIPLELNNYCLVILNTNKKRTLADSKYNERREQCEIALSLLSKKTGIQNLCEATVSQIEKYISEPVIRKRALHASTENQRVLDTCAALRSHDFIAFGNLLNESHRSLKENYEVSGHELDSIVDAAVKSPGCLGARMIGAGFGGCGLALVEKQYLDDFSRNVKKLYAESTEYKADLYPCTISDGVHKSTLV